MKINIPLLTALASATNNGTVIVPTSAPEQGLSAAGNTYFRQECAIIDTANIGANKGFTSILQTVEQGIPEGHFVLFGLDCLADRAVANASGRANIVLEVRIPASAPRVKIPVKA